MVLYNNTCTWKRTQETTLSVKLSTRGKNKSPKLFWCTCLFIAYSFLTWKATENWQIHSHLSLRVIWSVIHVVGCYYYKHNEVQISQLYFPFTSAHDHINTVSFDLECSKINNDGKCTLQFKMCVQTICWQSSPLQLHFV